MKKAERRIFRVVLDGLGGKGLIFAVQKIELTKHVRVIGRHVTDVNDDDAKFEASAQFEMTLQLARVHLIQLTSDDFVLERRRTATRRDAVDRLIVRV